MILDVKCFSLNGPEDCLFGVNDFRRRHVPVDFGVVRDASRLWASLSVRLTFIYDFLNKDNTFHFDVPQLYLVHNVEPVSVARAQFDGCCGDIYSTQTLNRTDAIRNLSLWPLIFWLI